jgi:hypothetical protein
MPAKVHGMNRTGAACPTMTPRRPTLLGRIKALLTRRRSPDVLVWVNTVDGARAVPVSRLRNLR